MGATKWQSIYKIVLRAALPGILTAIIFGMTRAFGEALAVQMVIGNAVLMPKGLGTPTATLTSQFDQSNGKYGFRNGLKQCIVVTGIGSVIDVTGLQLVDQGNYPERSN